MPNNRCGILILVMAILLLPMLASADTKPATSQTNAKIKWSVKKIKKGEYCFSQAKLFPGLCVSALSEVESPIALDWRDLPENKNIGLFTYKTANPKGGTVYAEHIVAVIDKRTKKVIGQAPAKGFYVGGYWEDEFALENWYEWSWTKKWCHRHR